MPSRTRELVEFDFDVYLRCKPFLAKKDRHLVATIIGDILSASRLAQPHLRFLDIGSGEGSVIHEICSLLQQTRQKQNTQAPNISVDCVEPCPDGISFLRQVAKEDRFNEYTLHETTIESFLASSRQTYDVINCCHVLYHIPRERWRSLIRSLRSALRSGGELFLNLVSSRSDIYRIKRELEREPRFQTLPRDFERFGFDVFAEDLELVLSGEDNGWTLHEIGSDIVFSKEDIDRGALQAFLSFMYRVDEQQFRRASSDKLFDVIGLDKDSVRFRSIDKMFVYKKS